MLRIKQEAKEPRSDHRQPGSRVLRLQLLTELPLSSGGWCGLEYRNPQDLAHLCPEPGLPKRCLLPPTHNYNSSLPCLWHQSPPTPNTAPQCLCPVQIDHSSRGIAKPPISSGIYHTSDSNLPKIGLLALWGSRSSGGSLLSRGPMACHWTMAPVPLSLSRLTCLLSSGKP